MGLAFACVLYYKLAYSKLAFDWTFAILQHLASCIFASYIHISQKEIALLFRKKEKKKHIYCSMKLHEVLISSN